MEDVATWVSYGASPRASLGLIAASRALALVRGRDYVLPQDVLDVTADVLRHRLVLSYDALADGVPADHIVKRIVQTVPLPQVAPRQNAGGFGPEQRRAARTCRSSARPATAPRRPAPTRRRRRAQRSRARRSAAPAGPQNGAPGSNGYGPQQPA